MKGLKKVQSIILVLCIFSLITPKSVDAFFWSYETCIRKAKERAYQKNFESERDWAKRALNKRETAEAYLILAHAHENLRNYKEVEKNLLSAAEDKTDTLLAAEAALLLAERYFKNDEILASKVWCQQSIELKTTLMAKAAILMAEIEEQLGNKSSALEWYGKALKAEMALKAYDAVLLATARINFEQQHFAQALFYLSKIKRPDDSTKIFIVVTAYLIGDHETGRKYYQSLSPAHQQKLRKVVKDHLSYQQKSQ